jgi:apolipoprotein N-acyltransferase
LEGSRREARAGARLIAWPEQNLLIFKEDESAFLERARRWPPMKASTWPSEWARSHVEDALPFENKLVVIDPTGAIVISYLKSHAVAGWEAGIMKRGDGRLPVVATNIGRIGAAICLRRRLSRVHSSGWPALRGSPHRARQRVEGHQGHSSANGGVPGDRRMASRWFAPPPPESPAPLNPWGRVLGTSDYFAPGDRTLTVQVPMGGIRTLLRENRRSVCVALDIAGLAGESRASRGVTR